MGSISLVLPNDLVPSGHKRWLITRTQGALAGSRPKGFDMKRLQRFAFAALLATWRALYAGVADFARKVRRTPDARRRGNAAIAIEAIAAAG
jgi:hypothetical protein